MSDIWAVGAEMQEGENNQTLVWIKLCSQSNVQNKLCWATFIRRTVRSTSDSILKDTTRVELKRRSRGASRNQHAEIRRASFPTSRTLSVLQRTRSDSSTSTSAGRNWHSQWQPVLSRKLETQSTPDAVWSTCASWVERWSSFSEQTGNKWWWPETRWMHWPQEWRSCTSSGEQRTVASWLDWTTQSKEIARARSTGKTLCMILVKFLTELSPVAEPFWLNKRHDGCFMFLFHLNDRPLVPECFWKVPCTC